MDRLANNYAFEGKYYTWNRISARNATPKYWDAPQFDFYVDQNNQRKNTLFGNFGLNYEINDNISATVEARRRFNSYESNGRTGWGGIDQASFSESTSRYVQNELAATLQYDERFDDFDVSAIVGYQATQNRNQSISASTVGGLSIPDFYSIATSVDRPNYSSSLSKSKVLSSGPLPNSTWFGPSAPFVVLGYIDAAGTQILSLPAILIAAVLSPPSTA